MLSSVDSEAPTFSPYVIKCTRFWGRQGEGGKARKRGRERGSIQKRLSDKHCQKKAAEITLIPPVRTWWNVQGFRWSRELSLCRCGEPGRTTSSLDPGQCCQPRQTHQRVPVHQPWQGLGPRGVCVMCAIVFFNPCISRMQWALIRVQSRLKGGH